MTGSREPRSLFASLAESRAVTACVVACFVALIGLEIGRSDTWFDESYTLLLVRGRGFADIAHRTAVDGHSPAFYWFVRVWFGVFGDSLLALRLQAAVGATIGAIAWHHFLRTRFDRRLALATLVLFTTSPAIVHYAIDGRMYGVGLALSSCAVVLATSRLRWRWIPLWPTCAALLWLHYFFSFVVAGVFVHVLWQRWRAHEPILWVVAYIATIIGSFAPWFPTALAQTHAIVNSGFWIQPVGPTAFIGYVEHAFLHRFDADLTSWRLFPGLAFFAAFALSFVAAVRSRGGTVRGVLWAVLAVPWGCLTLLSCKPLVPVLHERYVLCSLPALLALLVMGARTLPRRWPEMVWTTLLVGQLTGLELVHVHGVGDAPRTIGQVASLVHRPIDGRMPPVLVVSNALLFDALVTIPADQRVAIVRVDAPEFDNTDALYSDQPSAYIVGWPAVWQTLDLAHATATWLLEDAHTGGAPPPNWHVAFDQTFGAILGPSARAQQLVVKDPVSGHGVGLTMKPSLSIVIPAFSEARYLARSLDALHEFLVARDWLRTTEVVCVTADAEDGTPAIAAAKLRQFPHAIHVNPGPKVGKGRDVRAGMLAATGDVVLFMDADLATPLHHVERFVRKFADDSDIDVLIAVRDLRHIHQDWVRSASSQVANQLVQRLLLPGVRDTQCGFKAFRRHCVHELFAPMITMGWGFDFEILGRARLGGHQIVELDVDDWADPKGDEGLVGEVPWQASLRTLRELVRVWYRLNGPIAQLERRRKPPVTMRAVRVVGG